MNRIISTYSDQYRRHIENSLELVPVEIKTKYLREYYFDNLNDQHLLHLGLVAAAIVTFVVGWLAIGAFGLTGLLGMTALTVVGGRLIYYYGLRELLSQNQVREQVLYDLLLQQSKLSK
jgi:hypothetical protein